MALLTVCFFVTAVTVRFTFDRNELLLKDAREVEQNLHFKESLIRNFIADKQLMDKLKSVSIADRKYSEELIAFLTDKHHILVYTYEGDELRFWSSEKLIPENFRGPTQPMLTLKLDNGWYHAIQHKEEHFSAVFYIPIKSEYQKTNEFLRNRFSPDLISTNNLEIAEYNDRMVYNIRNQAGQFLFSVKLNATFYDSFYSDLELLMWLFGGISTLLLIHLFCVMLANSGRPWLSVIIFASIIIGLRLLEINVNWFASNFNIKIFNPQYYASSNFFPNLGAFFINIVLFTWLLGYLFFIRGKLQLHAVFKSMYGAIGFFILSTIFLFSVAYFLSEIFHDLVTHSIINFDVTDMLNLDFYSWMGILALCIGILGLMFAITVVTYLGKQLQLPTKKYYGLHFVLFLLSMVILWFAGQLNVYFFLMAGFVVLISWFSHSGKRFTLAFGVGILLLIASITSLKQTEYQRQKRVEAQKLAILNLEDVDDANALALFIDLEEEMLEDSTIVAFFKQPEPQTHEWLNDHLKTVYFSGYLSKYEFSADCYNAQLLPIGASSKDKLSLYRDKVISGAIKVSENFYRSNTSIGNFEYFALFPISEADELLGILLIDMSHRSFSQYVSYPGVLGDSRLNHRQSELISTYSFAYYRSGQLINQSGNYVYPVKDSLYYPLGIREFKRVGRDHGFSHMAYKPNQRTTIVLSKPQHGVWIQFASLSFFFLVFLVFFVAIAFLFWLFNTLNDNNFSFRNLKWNFFILSNRTLYSTRIQMFIVAAVVLTLIIAGLITYWSVSSQFVKQQEERSSKNVWEIAKGLEAQILKSGASVDQDDFEKFQAIAESNALDLNIYSTEGQLIYTTQPRIYDLKLISEYINPRALDQLGYYARSQYVQEQNIGSLEYLTAYSSIRNSAYEPIAFLSLPNYMSRQEFDKNIGGLLNTLINIYALVILVLGLFAVFVANRITSPLLLVQRSLAKTKIGKQNEPIFWRRNDEIGSLIREYNLMIAELEQSARTIMESERESAWKEMAKQVAHEIKNPLTPLKLGMQQLERSWKDKDPEFDQRFSRFKESFIEQIDSLTHIAKEFSDFAKMPDAHFVRFDLLEVINHSAAVFDSYGNVSIQISTRENAETLYVMGDKDQLLRTFNNLIKNSIEAVTNKRRCQIQINISSNSSSVFIEVKDNGEGISYEMRKKLFQPNFTTKSSGTGLGLAFVKRAVEVMGGTITYQTTLGKGTSFFIQLPLIN